MTVESITAGYDSIKIKTDANDGSAVSVCAYVPLINTAPGASKYPGRCVFSANVIIRHGTAEIPYIDAYELFICRFEITSDGVLADGVCYVTDIEDGFSMCSDPYPEISRRIGTWCVAPDEDVEYMRMGVMMDEIDEAWLYSVNARDDDIIHEWNGREYRFDSEHIRMHDRYLSKLSAKGIPTLIRFINRRKYQLRESDKSLFDVIKHPCYEDGFEGVEMSAVNLRTEEGLDRYCASLDFLFSRYARPNSEYGFSTVMDIGNEINSARIWHNAGKAECADFMEEYAVALRLAWLISQRYRIGYRVDVSLEMNFNRRYVDDPLRYYPAKECLTQLAAICRRDGDFYYGISAHPYPEFLDHPDFYNDRQPTFSLSTPIITMKNMEVWHAFLSLPEMLYRGRERRVVFDEQGFNTRTGEPYTEEQGAYAFVLAYLKIRKLDNVDMFLIHRHTDLDDGDEYGLHLGLRYFGGYGDKDHIFPMPGRRKLICDAIAAMDTEREEEWVRAARAYIGEGLFDYLLNPPEIK